MTREREPANEAWWRGAAIYQIYPRSFQDTDGDGIGDLPGITRRLDYVASLGVDAIWISPFFKSPMRDFGYDVSDYCDVDPVFGTLADFDALIAHAHALGVKVLVDQVYSHTSSDHPWFAESRQSVDNPKHDWPKKDWPKKDWPKKDWYVWADPKPDGSPPNNWQGVFGGPAWTWDARRRQYYLHNFLASQPQLNLHNPEVREALLGVARFWMDRGVDGFRIDALNFAMHDPQLRDNPPAPPSDKPRTRPFDYQIRRYNQFHPDTVRFLERLRAATDDYGCIFTLAEVGGDEDNVEMKRFTAGNHRLNSAYGFDFLYAEALTPQFVAEAMAHWPGEEGVGWPTWAFENHDAPRAVSRWCAPADMARFARVKMALFAALRGNIILYQGEELGLGQDDIPFELLRDPEAIANWPLTLSRDGARTPMPWTAEPLGGFTTGTPWLPLYPHNLARAVEVQEADERSQLNLTRQLLRLRKRHPALHHGALAACRAQGMQLELLRVSGGEQVQCLFNLGTVPVKTAPVAPAGEVILSITDATPDRLPPYSAIFVKL